MTQSLQVPTTLVLCQTSNSQTETMVRSSSLSKRQKIHSHMEMVSLDLVLSPSEVGQDVEETTFARMSGSIETSSVSHDYISKTMSQITLTRDLKCQSRYNWHLARFYLSAHTQTRSKKSKVSRIKNGPAVYLKRVAIWQEGESGSILLSAPT